MPLTTDDLRAMLARETELREKAERERDEALQIRDEVVVMVDRVVTAAEQRATGYREALEQLTHSVHPPVADIARQALREQP